MGAAPDIAMNGSQYETFLTPPFLRLGVGERAVRHRDIVPDIGQFDRRSMVLRIDGGPAVELQATGRRGVAQKGQRQLSVLRSVARTRDDDTRVGARQDLGLAVEIRRA